MIRLTVETGLAVSQSREYLSEDRISLLIPVSVTPIDRYNSNFGHCIISRMAVSFLHIYLHHCISLLKFFVYIAPSFQAYHAVHAFVSPKVRPGVVKFFPDASNLHKHLGVQ